MSSLLSSSVYCIKLSESSWMTSFLDRLKQETAVFFDFEQADLPVIKATQCCRAMAAHQHMVVFGGGGVGDLKKLLEKVELPFGWRKESGSSSRVLQLRSLKQFDDGVDVYDWNWPSLKWAMVAFHAAVSCRGMVISASIPQCLQVVELLEQLRRFPAGFWRYRNRGCNGRR